MKKHKEQEWHITGTVYVRMALGMQLKLINQLSNDQIITDELRDQIRDALPISYDHHLVSFLKAAKMLITCP